MRLSGRGFDDLTASNPTDAGFDYPADLLAPLASADALRYDPKPFGLPAAREAVAADYARRGVKVAASHVALTASSSESYALLFKLLCDPGDSVLVPTPSYPLFEHLTRLDSVQARPYATQYHGTWAIDLEDLKDAITDTTRAILVVSPNNPDRRVAEARRAGNADGACARSHGLALIGDEVFADYAIDPAPASQASVVEQNDVLTFSLGGLSKSVGLPQVKLGWIAASGPSPQLGAALMRLELIADTYLSVSTPVQIAAAHLLNAGASVREQIRRRVLQNYHTLRELANTCSACQVLRAEGGWSAVVRIPHTMPEDERAIRPARGPPRARASRATSSTSRVTATSWSACCRDPTSSAPPPGGCSTRSRPDERDGRPSPISAAPPAWCCRCSRSGRPATPASARSARSPRSADGSTAPASTRCSCCRSARCLRARRRRTRRSARWRSIPSTSPWTTWPTTGRPAATSGCRSPIRSRCGRHGRRLGWTTPTSARRSSPPWRWRSATSGTSTGCARRRARDRLPPSAPGKSGGSATTPSTARSGIGTPDGPGRSGPIRFAIGSPRRSTPPDDELEREILFHQYTQWLADEQWADAREQLGDVRLFGDFPFMVGIDSADVWANQHLFQFDRTTGTPPDAFSATGQDWGLPVYRWDVMRADDDRWLRQRVKRMGRLYDGYRVDHLVGFFRTYSRAIGEMAGRFDPGDEPDQIAQGERILSLFTNAPSQITAEDLGLIPDFVRQSLAKAGLPGYKVIRWERDWHMPGQPFVPPADLRAGLRRHDQHARHRPDRALVGPGARRRETRLRRRRSAKTSFRAAWTRRRCRSTRAFTS